MERELLSASDGMDYQPVVLRFATAFGLSPRMRFDLTVSEFTREMYLGPRVAGLRPRYLASVLPRARLRRRDPARARRAGGRCVAGPGLQRGRRRQQLYEAAARRRAEDVLSPTRPVRFQDHGGDPRNYRVDFSKIRDALHFQPSYFVRDGIAELVGALEQRLFDNVDDNPDLFGNYTIHYEARA